MKQNRARHSIVGLATLAIGLGTALFWSYATIQDRDLPRLSLSAAKVRPPQPTREEIDNAFLDSASPGLSHRTREELEAALRSYETEFGAIDAPSRTSDDSLATLLRRAELARRVNTALAERREFLNAFRSPLESTLPPSLRFSDTDTDRLVEHYQGLVPLESLRPRLQYEIESAAAKETPRLGADAVRRQSDRFAVYEDAVLQFALATSGERWREYLRIASLKELHSENARRFVLADGFGATRIGRPSIESLVVPTEQVVDLFEHRFEEDLSVPPSKLQLFALHDDATLEFTGAWSLGVVRDVDHVAGFLTHGFRSQVETRRGRRSVSFPSLILEKARHERTVAEEPKLETSRWRVHVRLVSLLKHATPRVYVSRTMPNMQASIEPSDTRTLDPFETAALEKLRDGEELVAEIGPNEIRMLGSLRAQESCLHCHQTQPGALLGAFTYDLTRP